MRIGILSSHPIQYQAPWFRALAKAADLHVFYARERVPVARDEERTVPDARGNVTGRTEGE